MQHQADGPVARAPALLNVSLLDGLAHGAFALRLTYIRLHAWTTNNADPSSLIYYHRWPKYCKSQPQPQLDLPKQPALPISLQALQCLPSKRCKHPLNSLPPASFCHAHPPRSPEPLRR